MIIVHSLECVERRLNNNYQEWENNKKIKNRVGGCGLNWSGSGQGQVMGCFESNKKLLSCIKSEKYIVWVCVLSAFQGLYSMQLV